jgi:hypothetical protein
MSDNGEEQRERRQRRLPSTWATGDLAAWEGRCGFRRDEEAAKVLFMHVQSYRAKRSGASPITAQEMALCLYYETFSRRLIAVLDAVLTLTRLIDIPLPKIGSEKIQSLTDVLGSRNSDV